MVKVIKNKEINNGEVGWWWYEDRGGDVGIRVKEGWIEGSIKVIKEDVNIKFGWEGWGI